MVAGHLTSRHTSEREEDVMSILHARRYFTTTVTGAGPSGTA